MTQITTAPKLEPVNFQDIQALSESLNLRLQNAIAYKKTLDAEIAKGITPELDETLKRTIQNLKAAKDDFNAKRSPLTKRLQEIVKMFTEKENTVQALADDLQKHRNDSAAKVAKENKGKQRQAQIEQYKTQEAIDLKAAIEVEIRTWVQSLSDKMELGILAAMKTVTLENKEEKRKKLQSMNTALDPLVYGNYETKLVSRFGNDVLSINNDLLLSLEAELLEKYQKQVETAKHEALLMFNTIATMDEKTKEATIAAKEQDAIIESASVIEVIQEAVSIQADASKAEAAYTAVVETIEMPDAKKSYEIVLLDDAAGYSALVPYWFAICAKDFKGNWSTRSFDQCRKDLEKHATTTGTKLESKYIEYKDKFKAK